MDKNNRKTMQIPSDLLKESNYEGTRLIKIDDENVTTLQAELNALQKEALPFLEQMEAVTPSMDPIYAEIQELERKKAELQKQVAPFRAKYDEIAKNVEAIDDRAYPIKEKMTTIIFDLVKDQLGEFEMAMHTRVKEGVIYVEVQDVIEEKVKAHRASKVKNG